MTRRDGSIITATGDAETVITDYANIKKWKLTYMQTGIDPEKACATAGIKFWQYVEPY
jgi:DNA/RNA-binding domain of Phe-tRNA-synthetase-like protein